LWDLIYIFPKILEMATVHEASSKGFSTNAGEYHRVRFVLNIISLTLRPGYSSEVVRLIVEKLHIHNCDGTVMPGSRVLGEPSRLPFSQKILELELESFLRR
jgi:hypothetical protein